VAEAAQQHITDNEEHSPQPGVLNLNRVVSFVASSEDLQRKTAMDLTETEAAAVSVAGSPVASDQQGHMDAMDGTLPHLRQSAAPLSIVLQRRRSERGGLPAPTSVQVFMGRSKKVRASVTQAIPGKGGIDEANMDDEDSDDAAAGCKVSRNTGLERDNR